ncbi:MAG: hypothetical protein ABL933_15790 [Methyloglobulus sp.]
MNRETYASTIYIANREYPVEVEYRDGNDCLSKAFLQHPNPDVVIEHILIKPGKWSTLDLMDDEHAWLLEDGYLFSLQTEIEGDIIQKFWANRHEARSAA